MQNDNEKELKILLRSAIMDNDYIQIRKLLTQYPKLINIFLDEEGNTPLLSAIAFSNCKIIQLLVEEFYADVNKGDNENFTPIFQLSALNTYLKHTKCIDVILDKNPDVNTSIITQKTPLMLATQYGNIDMVTILLQRGANALAIDRNNLTALHWMGLYNGDLYIDDPQENEIVIDKIVKLLIDNGANIDSCDDFGYTPLGKAKKYNEPLVEKALRKYGAKKVMMARDL